MSLSSLVVKIAVPLAALCVVVALPMAASAEPAGDSDSTAPASATDCFPGDGHSWHN